MGHSESISALFCFTCASSFASLIKVYLSCLYLCPCLLFEWSLFCYPHETKRNFTEIRLLSGLKQLENHLLKLYFVPTWGGRGGGNKLEPQQDTSTFCFSLSGNLVFYGTDSCHCLFVRAYLCCLSSVLCSSCAWPHLSSLPCFHLVCFHCCIKFCASPPS